MELQGSFNSILSIATAFLIENGQLGFFICDTDGHVVVLPDEGPFSDFLSRFGIEFGQSYLDSEHGDNAIGQAIKERVGCTSRIEGKFGNGNIGNLSAEPVLGLRGSLRAVVGAIYPDDVPSSVVQLILKLSANSFGALFALGASRNNLAQLVSEQHAIIDNISDGLIVLDRDHVIRFMNAPAGRILNLVPKSAIGNKLEDLLDYKPVINEVFETGVGFMDRETIRETRDRRVHLLDTAIPIMDESGVVRSVVNTFREIQSVRRIAHRIAGNHARYTFKSLIGDAPIFREALATAKQAAKGDATVLLSGESGTGKEVFAQALHNESKRSDAPFVALNCAALPRELIESELFGYAPGSFTGANRSGRPGKFELASGGTIFLDEISELPFDVQAKLLRVLQERQVVRIGDSKPIDVNVRVVAASNKNLTEMVENNLFREDLFYRIHVIDIRIPALRERRDDIPQMATTFLRKFASSLNKNVFRIDENALQSLCSYHWPGNVRQLENVIERAVYLSDDETIMSFDLGPHRDENSERMETQNKLAEFATGKIPTLQEVERQAIVVALNSTDFNVTKAAEALGTSRPTLYAKIRRHGVLIERRISDISESET